MGDIWTIPMGEIWTILPNERLRSYTHAEYVEIMGLKLCFFLGQAIAHISFWAIKLVHGLPSALEALAGSNLVYSCFKNSCWLALMWPSQIDLMGH